MRVSIAQSPFPPGTTTYMQVGDAEGGVSLATVAGMAAGGYLGYQRMGVPGAIAAGFIGKTFPRLTLAYLAWVSLA